MSKLISKLPEDIKKVALQRQRECENKRYSKSTDELEEAFKWSETIEGHSIWRDVLYKIYQPFYEFHKQNINQKTNNMTKFINLENLDKEVQEKKETVLTHYLSGGDGWIGTKTKLNEFDKIVYLGKCQDDGDLFAGYTGNVISIYKGIKGDEFE